MCERKTLGVTTSFGAVLGGTKLDWDPRERVVVPVVIWSTSRLHRTFQKKLKLHQQKNIITVITQSAATSITTFFFICNVTEQNRATQSNYIAALIARWIPPSKSTVAVAEEKQNKSNQNKQTKQINLTPCQQRCILLINKHTAPNLATITGIMWTHNSQAKIYVYINIY